MILGDLPKQTLERALRDSGLRLRIGPFTVDLRAPIPSVSESLRVLYEDYPVENGEGIADFHVLMKKPSGIRHVFRRQVLFFSDGQTQFQPFPYHLAPPLFEWGLNWCISTRAHQYLMFHAAVVERQGRALLLPGRPGSGKSTLCAALVARGFRLLSDEHALVRPSDGTLVPVPRPIALKNASIPAIRKWAPELVLGPTYHDTHKGSVTHVRPLTESIEKADESARPAGIVFPRFEDGAPARLQALGKARAMMALVDNAINYSLLGVRGFETSAGLIDRAATHTLVYGELEDAVEALDRVG